eukprot:gene4025-20194_t
MEDESFTVYSILSLPSQEISLGENDSENGNDRLEDLDERPKTVLLQLLNKSKQKTKASCEIWKKSPKTESKGKNGLNEVPSCQCENDSRYQSNLSFHCFPKNEATRKVWIAKIRRDPGRAFSITNHAVVCSAHFRLKELKTSQAGKRSLKSGAVPTIFSWQEEKTKRKSPQKRKLLVKTDYGAVRYEENEATAAACSEGDDRTEEQLSLEEKHEKALKRVQELTKEVEKLKMERFGLYRYAANDAMICFYTGFQSNQLLRQFILVIRPTALKMTTWQQVQRQRLSGKAVTKSTDFSQHASCLEDQLFLFLCKLRLGSFNQELADRFNTSTSTVWYFCDCLFIRALYFKKTETWVFSWIIYFIMR